MQTFPCPGLGHGPRPLVEPTSRVAAATKFLGALVLTASVATFPSAQCELDSLQVESPVTGGVFGDAVSIDGTRALIGASLENGSGAAYIFDRVDGAWSESIRLQPTPAPAAGDSFGFRVALEGDTAVVGSLLEDGAGEDAGAAYVFEFDGELWSQVATLRGSDALPGDLFSIGLDIQGDRIAVGACQFFGFLATGVGRGKGYIFERQDGNWVEQHINTAADGAHGDRFAVNLAIDGKRILYGAEDDDSGAGSAYIFEYEAGAWIERQKLPHPAAAAGDQFGVAVALDGDLALIGAHNADAAGIDSGTAYVYRRGQAQWQFDSELLPSAATFGSAVGRSVALSLGMAVVGAPDDTNLGPGSVHVFARNHGTWVEMPELAAAGTENGSSYGDSLSARDNLLMVGSPGDLAGAGRAVTFRMALPPRVTKYGCGVNPSGSLEILSGQPRLGQTITVGVDNPLGTQAPGSLSFLSLRFGPDPAFPCGTLLPGWGMDGAGSSGELLTTLAGPGFLIAGPLWNGPGQPAPIPVRLPADCELAGLQIYSQGLIIDPVAAMGVSIGLTEAAEMRIGL